VAAQIVDELAQRYGQLPSAVLAEDARLMLGMRALLAEAQEDAPDG
jgi:hypothetical protein